MSERVLVIKLAALGDFVQAFGPFAAIRAHHPGAEITLLTTPPYAELARLSPWFDAVWTDGRPSWSDPAAIWRLARRLRGAGFARVYDLQTSARSSRYRWLVGRGVEWSGIARGASHPHANPRRDLMHTVERQREQLEMAGIREFPAPDLGWLDGDVAGLGLPPRFALLVPGASPARPGKRWPVGHFAALAAGLDLPVAVVGGPAEAPLAAAILAAAPGGVDLTGRTGYAALGAVARRAEFALGNDTGPTHLIAATGCPTLALFGPESEPALCAPRGRAVAVLQRDSLAGLTVAEARVALSGLVAA
ncbi:glycosyltransferase family 9 protein [Dankookia sp. GCM10030260]|uniref:glycosyltransferase family 9 protein n=1 Tax=Dankookia sp. GCM10030260 TaxID=3273390 RepID=UPI003614F290